MNQTSLDYQIYTHTLYHSLVKYKVVEYCTSLTTGSLQHKTKTKAKTTTEEVKIRTTGVRVTGTQYMELNAHGRMVLKEQ